jgi:hypothetical protein
VRASASTSGSPSTAITSAPRAASAMASVPVPQPTSTRSRRAQPVEHLRAQAPRNVASRIGQRHHGVVEARERAPPRRGHVALSHGRLERLLALAHREVALVQRLADDHAAEVDLAQVAQRAQVSSVPMPPE